VSANGVRTFRVGMGCLKKVANRIARFIAFTPLFKVFQFANRSATLVGRYHENIDIYDERIDGEENLLRKLSYSGFEPRTILDVGANKGQWYQLAKAYFPGSRIISVEPSITSFSVLKAVNKEDSFNIALTISDGVLDFYERGFASEHSSLSMFGSKYDDDDSVTARHKVVAKRLDSFLQSIQVERLDILKIDTEGHDRNVLEGSTYFLKNQLITIVEFEYNQKWLLTKSCLRDAIELLASNGYSIYKLMPSELRPYRWKASDEGYNYGIFIAILKSFPHAYLL